MNNIEFINKAIDIATKYKTLYVMGCFGAPLNTSNKKRYTSNHSFNMSLARKRKINKATNNTFGFDCVNLIKAILWGWSGKLTDTYGGAKYCANLPDVSADTILNYCTNVSCNFKNIEKGEVLHMAGHVGIYVGNGLAVECTPAWDDQVQITAVGNIGKKKGYNTRTWVNHGKLKYIEYTNTTNTNNTVTHTTGNKLYFPKYAGKSNSIVDIFKILKLDSSFNNRKKIAKVNGISVYLGTAKQNNKLVSLAKQGKLLKK